MAKNVFDVFWHRIQIALGGTDPLDGLACLLQHRFNYARLGISPSTLAEGQTLGNSGFSTRTRRHAHEGPPATGSQIGRLKTLARSSERDDHASHPGAGHHGS
jgi:hypothetical protein